jgi:hypothetical protein
MIAFISSLGASGFALAVGAVIGGITVRGRGHLKRRKLLKHEPCRRCGARN